MVAALQTRERQLLELQEVVQDLKDRNQCLESRNIELLSGTSRAALTAQRASSAGAKAREAREEQVKKLHNRISAQEEELLRLRAAAYTHKSHPPKCAELQLMGSDAAVATSQQIWAGLPPSLSQHAQRITPTVGCGPTASTIGCSKVRRISPQQRLHCNTTGYIFRPVSADSSANRDHLCSSLRGIRTAAGCRSISPMQLRERRLSSGQSHPPPSEMSVSSPPVPFPVQSIFGTGSTTAQKLATWPQQETQAVDVAGRQALAMRLLVASSPCRRRFAPCPTPLVPPLLSSAPIGQVARHISPVVPEHALRGSF